LNEKIEEIKGLKVKIKENLKKKAMEFKIIRLENEKKIKEMQTEISKK